MPDISAIHDLGGRDVLVGIVDTGVDWRHDDFRKSDGSTRIVMSWDQTDNCAHPPPGYTYGCLWTEADINDALGSGPPVDADDTDGHGSHVAGITAGNGLGTGNGEPAETYVGIAREARFIVVDIFPDSGVSCSDCDAGDALAFIDQQASVLGMPASVNFSFGNQFYDHEDTDPWGQVIDTVTGPGIQGRVVTKSAGNSRDAPIHDTGVISTGTSNTHFFELPSYSPAPGVFNDLHVFNIWYPAGDLLTVQVTGPLGSSHSASTGDGFTGVGTVDGVIIIDDADSPMPNGKQFFTVELDDQLGTAPRSGTWTLRITGNSVGSSGEYHMWTWYSRLGTSGLSGRWLLPDLTTLISEPGNSAHVITVGGYVTKTEWENVLGGVTGYTPAPTIGDLLDVSSPGPTADGRLRPHIAAPGMGIASSLSSTVSGSVDPLRVVTDGVHWVIEGTSMSAPHVAGCVALLLEANPCLDATATRSILAETARVDSYVTTPPNNDWGYGKLDIAAAVDRVVMHVPDLTAQPDAQTFTWTPHAAADSHNVHRGLLSSLDGVNYGAVIHSGVTVPSFSDVAVPPVGDGFFYAVETVDSDGIEGVKGFSFACEPGEHSSCEGFELGHMIPWGKSCS
jgi:subtilisin family serine protease